MPAENNSVFQDNKYSGVYADLTWTTLRRDLDSNSRLSTRRP